MSYLDEVVLERVSSELNPILIVSLRRGKLMLSTNNAIYSFDEYYDNFGHTFNEVQLPHNGSQVLILGGGLGSIPLLLENIHQRDYEYLMIEKDHAVIDLCSRYTLPRLNSMVEIVEADAYSFVMQSTQKFFMICMDVFKSDIIPEKFKSKEFLYQLKKSLTSDGILLYNCLALTKEDLSTTKAFLEEQFLQVFPNAGYIKAHGNWILINDVSKSI